MLKFDSRGNLKPYEAIPCTVSEMKKVFVKGIPSDTREDNFRRYLKYSDDLKVLLKRKTIKQWINGSFVTKKTNPKDIDLVTFIEYEDIQRIGYELRYFRAPLSWAIYDIDAYLVAINGPKNHESYKKLPKNLKYWTKQFTLAKPNRSGIEYPKGFLEILY